MVFQFLIDRMDLLDKDKILVKFLKEKNGWSYGDKFRTMLNLEILKSDADNNLLYIKGSIPGSKNSTVFLKSPLKILKENNIRKV